MKLKNRNILIAIVVFGLVIVLTQIFISFNYTSNLKEVYVRIEKGEGLKLISKNLKDKEVIRSSVYFTIYTKLRGMGDKIKYGNYIIPPRIKIDDLLQRLQNPKSDYVVVTIPEGFSFYQIAKKLESINLVNFEKLIDIKIEEIESPKDMVNISGKYYSLEGYLFPDTYYIPVEFTEKDIVKLMYNRFQTVFSNEYYKRAEELGLSINEVITIASLIEKEAANDSERNRIAGVIYNRLKIDMPLQIDASVIYGINKGEKNISRVTYNDLESDSEYNTYKNKGLPPGPIASPGHASIEAALYPEKHNYLFYVLGNDGHVFSETYDEHVKNVRRYIK